MFNLKIIVKNAGWLGLIQFLNYMIPLITLPIITRAFGPKVYGIFATLNAYAVYVGVVGSYGFIVTGPRSVARLRADTLMLSKTVSEYFCAQLLLGTLATIIFIGGLPLIPNGTEYRLVGVIVLAQVFATAITPQWVFIGLEHIRDFALIQFAFRGLAAALVVFGVRAPGDLLFYVGVNCIAAAAVLVFSIVRLGRIGIGWEIPSISELFLAIRQATHLFLSKVSISLYTSTTILIVAFILGPNAAGIFALADRVRQVAGNIIDPITDALYPFICRIAGRDATQEEAWTKRVFFRGVVILSTLISIALFVFAPFVIWFLAGNEYQDAALVLRIIAFLPLIITLSRVFGYQTMIPLYLDRQFTWVVTSAAIFGVTGVCVFTKQFGLLGAALTMLAVEIYVTIAFALFVQRRQSVLSLFFDHR